jgi:hypothetical protein
LLRTGAAYPVRGPAENAMIHWFSL